MIGHAFSKPNLVNLISKYWNLVFCLSVYRDIDIIIDFCSDSASRQPKICPILPCFHEMSSFS